MALSDLFGINSTAGTSQLQAAYQALQAVNVPNIAQLTMPQLQKYVSAGVLTPEQYQAVSADPNAFQTVANQADMSGQAAQKQALQQLSGVVQAGGSTPINQANLQNNIQQTNQAMQAARSGIMEGAQERGVSGGGLDFINQLMNEQSNAQTANTGAVNAASNNAQLALNAMTQGGQLGGQIQSQSSADALAKAQAAQQVGEYNSQLQSAAKQYNTQNANQAQQMNLSNAQNISNQNTGNANDVTEYNAKLPQTEFRDQMQKAQGLAGNLGQQGSLAQNQAQQQNAFTGSLIGAGATLAGGYLAGPAGAAAANAATSMPAGTDVGSNSYYQNAQKMNPNNGYARGGEVKCYAQGGEVHDHTLCMKVGGPVPGEPNVPGDSTQNDTVPANLSPHEIVLPNTVTQGPNPVGDAAKFVAQTKGMTPTAGSFAEVLKLLEANGLELRLSAGSH